jgi:hypothetical protein
MTWERLAHARRATYVNEFRKQGFTAYIVWHTLGQALTRVSTHVLALHMEGFLSFLGAPLDLAASIGGSGVKTTVV